MIDTVLLLAGLALLLASGWALVRGATTMAIFMGVSQWVVGLTVVAMGTSAPEMAVTLAAAVRGEAGMAMGNVIGSNLFNLLLILGLTGTIVPLQLTQSLRWREIPFALLSILVFAALVNDQALSDRSNMLDRGDGFALLGFFAIYLYYLFTASRGQNNDEAQPARSSSLAQALLLTLLGLAGLFLGGELSVRAASRLALALGVSEATVGLTVLALGTSLPELITSLMAARLGNADLAVGNIVGSNIFNILWILGLSACVAPMPFAAGLNADLGLLALATILFFVFTYTGSRHRLDRAEAACFLALYIGYLGFLVWRG